MPVPHTLGKSLQGIVIPVIDHHGISCVPSTQYHLTLAFLGERTEQDLIDLFERFDQTLQHSSPRRISCTGILTFPSGAVPRTIVTPVTEGRDEIIRISRDLRSSLKITGRMGKPIPHLTLARVRKGTSIDRGKLVRSLGPLIDITFIPEEIVLYRSHLERSGSRYEKLRSIRLHK